MKKQAIEPKSNKATFIKSELIFVRYKNWKGEEKTQAIPARTESAAKKWLKDTGFVELEVKQIYFQQPC